MRLFTNAWRQLSRERSREELNALYLYLEIIFFGFLGAAASFDGAYVVRLGASNALVGLQTSLPALAAALVYLPAAHFLERRSNPFRWITGSLAVVRIMYLFMILWPLVAMPMAAPLVVGTIVAMQLPAVVFATGWSPLMADVIPERSRARVLSGRMILMSAIIGILTYGFGFWLEHAPFPLNYQAMYGLGVLGGIGSIFFLSKLKLPTPEDEDPQRRIDEQKAPVLAGAMQVFRENRFFRTILINTLVFNTGAWMVMPLYTILFIKQLQAGDGWLGLRTMLLQAGGLVGYVLWRRVTEKWGDARTLLLALPLVTTFPFLLAAFPNLTVILFLSLWVSLISPGVDLPHSMIFMEQLPKRRRHMAVALYSMAMNMAAFVMPLIGVQLAAWIGLTPTLVIGGTLRAIGVALFYWQPIKEGMSARALFGSPRARRID
jgi:MFS family permease